MDERYAKQQDATIPNLIHISKEINEVSKAQNNMADDIKKKKKNSEFNFENYH